MTKALRRKQKEPENKEQSTNKTKPRQISANNYHYY
jgi:hypothetical protein